MNDETNHKPQEILENQAARAALMDAMSVGKVMGCIVSTLDDQGRVTVNVIPPPRFGELLFMEKMVSGRIQNMFDQAFVPKLPTILQRPKGLIS